MNISFYKLINPLSNLFFSIKKGFLAPGELDPLNRRLITEPKPEGFVQVCILTDSEIIQSRLGAVGVHIQLVKDLELVQVRSVQVLQNIYSHLGKNERLGLTGRPSFEMGPFSTSKLYTICGRTLAFTPAVNFQTIDFFENEYFFFFFS